MDTICKKVSKQLRFILCGLILLIFTASCVDNDIRVIDLRCMDRIDPLGVEMPQLSWKIDAFGIDVTQSAWEIEMASTPELLKDGKADIWSSGKRKSEEQFGIIPEVTGYADATRYYWRVRVWENPFQASDWSELATFVTGLSDASSWLGKWITSPDSLITSLPYFRKEFNLNVGGSSPVSAIVYLSGLGCSELYLNGRKVDSTRFLDPAQTNYEQYALYTTYDVTDNIKKGENCIGVMLGSGWFSQDEGWRGAPFGYGKPMLRLQMVVEYSDGTRTIIVSDDSWHWKAGPVTQSNIYLGELYDARQEDRNWCLTDTAVGEWHQAVPATENSPPELVSQIMEPIRTHKPVKPVGWWKSSTGSWIFDFGINTAGIPHLQVTAPAGSRLDIRISEEKTANGDPDFSTLGWIHHGDYFTYSYICQGDEQESWIPRFTYHGFRYAELSGLKGEPDENTLNLIPVYNDVPTRAVFECSDPQINRLHQLAMNTLVSNLHGIPTDCPNREKCGWLGDTHAYVKMANLNLQMNNFWLKYLEDIRSGAERAEKNSLFHERYNNIFYTADKPSGLPYMIAPGKRLCGVASPDWGTALVQIPWWLYVYYGNKQVLHDFYPDMQQWTDYVSSLGSDTARTNKYEKSTSHIIYQGLGDWCPPVYPELSRTPVEFTSTAFHYLDVSIMEQVAAILDKRDDAQRYANKKEDIASELIEMMYDPILKTFGSQTADAMALDLGLVPPGDEEKVAESIVRHMNTQSEGFINCGIFGIARVGSMLARYGQADAAWDIFTRRGENSFAWMWGAADATSLWEILPVNRLSEERAAESSHSHPMQGGYDVTFIEDIGGIRPDSSGFGFKVIRFDPLFTSCLDWAKVSLETAYGQVSSNWSNDDDKLSWHIRIPANSSGRVVLPAGKDIYVNGEKLNDKQYKLITKDDNSATYYFPSGNFEIDVWH